MQSALVKRWGKKNKKVERDTKTLQTRGKGSKVQSIKANQKKKPRGTKRKDEKGGKGKKGEKGGPTPIQENECST